MSSVLEHGPITATADEQAALQQLEQAIAAGLHSDHSPGLKLVGADSAEIELPESVLQVLGRSVMYLAHDQAVEVVSVSKELTFPEAADILGVPVSYVSALADEGFLPIHQTGAQQYVALDDLLAFKRPDAAQRRQALRELTQMSQEMGLYDL